MHPPPNVEILILNELRGGTFGKYLGHEGRAFIRGISVLRKQTSLLSPPSSVALVPPCEDTTVTLKDVHQKRALTRTQLCLVQSQFPKLWEINPYCC